MGATSFVFWHRALRVPLRPTAALVEAVGAVVGGDVEVEGRVARRHADRAGIIRQGVDRVRGAEERRDYADLLQRPKSSDSRFACVNRLRQSRGSVGAIVVTQAAIRNVVGEAVRPGEGAAEGVRRPRLRRAPQQERRQRDHVERDRHDAPRDIPQGAPREQHGIPARNAVEQGAPHLDVGLRAGRAPPRSRLRRSRPSPPNIGQSPTPPLMTSRGRGALPLRHRKLYSSIVASDGSGVR
jgi:hypothetical protein